MPGANVYAHVGPHAYAHVYIIANRTPLHTLACMLGRTRACAHARTLARSHARSHARTLARTGLLSGSYTVQLSLRDLQNNTVAQSDTVTFLVKQARTAHARLPLSCAPQNARSVCTYGAGDILVIITIMFS